MTPASEAPELRTPVSALWVVALTSELTALLPLLRRARLRSHRLCVGWVGHRKVALLRSGVGPQYAQERTLAALARVAPQEVWSIGSCGALRDGLSQGTVLTAGQVLDPQGLAGPVLPVANLPAMTVFTARQPVFDASRRSTLAGLGADVVEMEAAGVLRAVQSTCPVRVLKVVSDLAGGEDDTALHGPRALAMARFHMRVERLVRTRLAPLLAHAGPER